MMRRFPQLQDPILLGIDSSRVCVFVHIFRCRSFGTTRSPLGRLHSASCQSEERESIETPRWACTPSTMQAPHKARTTTENTEYSVNESSLMLDDMFIKLLGKEGDKVLPESIKWLTITHKSFDHGKRGFNERLAFLGKRIVELHTSLALFGSPRTLRDNENKHHTINKVERRPFVHRSLENVEYINKTTREYILDQQRVARLAERYGLSAVIRWKPKQVHDLKSSGFDHVLAESLYAVIGAIALQKGGAFVKQVVRSRFLNPLGIR